MVRFGVISDCQYTDQPDMNFFVESPAGDWSYESHRMFRSSPSRLQRAVDYFNTQPLDFVVHLGDFAERDAADFAPVLKIAAQLKAPLYHVLGNHDYNASQKSTAKACQNLGLERPYYSFNRQEIRFIVLNSNELGLVDVPLDQTELRQQREAFLRQLRAEGKPYAQSYNGGIDSAQLHWLRQELTAAQEQNQLTVIFSHHPVFPPNMHNMLNCEEVLALLDEFPPLAFMNGHNHVGAFGVRRSVPYVTFPALLESTTEAHSVVTVEQSTITLRGFGTHRDGQFVR